MFVKRIHQYAVKTLKSGAARLYVQSSDALRKAGLPENTAIKVEYSKHRIVVTADENGGNKIMDTGRGALLELKNKSTAESIGDLQFVTVTFRRGKVIISIHYSDKQKMEREQSLFNAITNGKIRTSSFFSGLGMLSYHLKKGLEKAGVNSEVTFANDACEVAMECNLAGNPMWDNASDDAYAVVDTLANIDIRELVQAHFLEIGYPCVAQSTLCKKEHRDLEHPIVGTLFVKLMAAIEKINPAIVLFENTPAFKNSDTLRFIKREMPGYRFEEVIFNGHEFGEMEARKRVCIVAVSEGLPEVDLASVIAPKKVSRPILSQFMDDVPANSELWRKMEHVKRKAADEKLNYKNIVYRGYESLIGTLTARYASPKAGAPMIAHPTDPDLQRQFTVEEHARLRLLPKRMYDAVMNLVSGNTPVVSSRGSKTAAHRVLGNGVSKYVWNAVGEHLGLYLQDIKQSINKEPELMAA